MRPSLLRHLPGWLPAAIALLIGLGGVIWDAFDDAREKTAPAPPAIRVEPARSYDPADWITSDDYPYESIRREEEGMVRIRWTVTPGGRAANCSVIDSSGFPRLDEAACNAIVRRARYRPDISGTAAEPRTRTRRVVWRLPD